MLKNITILMISLVIASSSILDTELSMFGAIRNPVIIPFEDLQINGIEMLDEAQKMDAMSDLKLLIEMFNSRNVSYDIFTDEAQMICSGVVLPTEEIIKFHIKNISMLQNMSIQTAGVSLYDDSDAFRISGTYLWNGKAIKQYILIFVREKDKYKIDESIIIGC